MKSTTGLVVAVGFGFLAVLASACSSSETTPEPPVSDTSDAGDAGEPESDPTGANGDPEADGSAACGQEGAALSKADSDVCCDGLFKACAKLTQVGNPTPCTCSTIECGTEDHQPPPNVPCCPGVASSCTSLAGSTQTVCTCGEQR